MKGIKKSLDYLNSVCVNNIFKTSISNKEDMSVIYKNFDDIFSTAVICDSICDISLSYDYNFV